MSDNPLVTVICLCYNHEAYVEESLNSVINQLYSPIQLIIVDDFSTDNSKASIKSWLEDHRDIQFSPMKRIFEIPNHSTKL